VGDECIDTLLIANIEVLDVGTLVAEGVHALQSTRTSMDSPAFLDQ